MNSTLFSRLAAKRSGNYVSPFNRSYGSRWGGVPFPIGGNVGYRSTFGRWHESPETPFRFVGLAHEIISLRHTGWYTRHDEYDDLARGVVYLLPHGRYIAAIVNSHETDKDGSGPCIVEVNASGSPCLYDDKEDAARAADSFAERYAESARDDDRLQSKIQRIEDARDEAAEALKTSRDDARALLAEIRNSRLSPGLCERMRGELRALRRDMHSAFTTIKGSNKALAAL